MIEYRKHRLSREIIVQEIVSADYVQNVLPSVHSHRHEDAWELCACLKGETVVTCDQKRFTLAASQLFLIHPGALHEISVYREDSAAFIVSFTCTNTERLLPLLETPLRIDEQQTSFFRQIITELDQAYTRHDETIHLFQFDQTENSPFGAEQVICCYLELALISLLRSVTMDEGRIVPSDRFTEAINTYLTDQVTQYIDDHLSERLTVESIAGKFHYSRARLSTLYKNITGQSIKETLDEKRIRQAKLMLVKKEKSILQISEDLGFSSPSYFTHRFTRVVGMSPSEFAAFAASGSFSLQDLSQ